MNYNILFFENYLKLLGDDRISNINLEEFLNFSNQSSKNVQVKKYKSEMKMEHDVIDENIKAFDESLKHKIERKFSEEEKEKRQNKIIKAIHEDEKENDERSYIVHEEDFKMENFKEENYFKDLIKRNFEG